MAEIVRTYRQELPALRFIGKKYADIPHWDEWFANGWFTQIENAAGTAQAVHSLYEDGDAYIGFMRMPKDAAPEYWIGMFTAPGTVPPEGFESIEIAPASIGVCWIKGVEPDVYVAEGDCPAACVAAGFAPCEDAGWSFERYVCPRFTTPDAEGNIVLDYCMPIR